MNSQTSMLNDAALDRVVGGMLNVISSTPMIGKPSLPGDKEGTDLKTGSDTFLPPRPAKPINLFPGH